jgi:predicted metal-dependent hydrolase
MNDYILHDNKRIEYNVVYRDRKTVGITANRYGVKISAPPWVSKKQLKEIVGKKAEWISKKLLQSLNESEKFKKKNGKELYYLGNEYRMIVIHDDSLKGPMLNLTEDGFMVFISTKIRDQNRAAYIKKAVLKWYKEKALKVFNDRVGFYSNIIGVRPLKVSVKKQRTRWGSCSSKGNISLNLKLLMLPLEIIDYVVVHELTHLKIMNHSKDFWKAVGLVIPEYRNRIKELKGYRQIVEYSGLD